MKKHVISNLNREMFVNRPEAPAQHEDIGTNGLKGIMELLSLQLKNSGALRQHIDLNIAPEEATAWYKELRKQEFTTDYIRRHAEFNAYYNDKTGRNNVEPQPTLLDDVEIYLIEEGFRKEQAEKQEEKL